MDELKPPDELACFGAQCDHGVCPLVVSWAKSAIIIGTWAAGGDEDQIALGIDGHDRPGVGGTAAKRLRFAIGNAIGWQRIPTPSQRAGARIIGADYAARHIRAVIIVDCGADDHEVVDDGWRRSHVIPASVIARYFAQTHLASLTEIGASCAGCGVNGHQPCVLGDLKDSAAARPASRAR